MKRYLVFAGESYYPQGGWGDFVGCFQRFEDACRAMHEASSKYNHYDEPWGQVVDTEHSQVVGHLGGPSKSWGMAVSND